jgi:hypothetical protein
MAKKNAKTAPETAVPSEAAKETQRQVNLIVKTADISDRKTEKTDKEGNKTGEMKDFKSVRLPLKLDGKTVFGSIAVDDARVRPATKPVKNEDGTFKKDENGKQVTTPIEGYSNVWLKGENSKVKVNLPDKTDENGKTTSWKNVEFTAGDVEKMNSDAKKDYKASLKEKESVKETPEVAAPEAAVEEQLGE